MVRFGVRSDKGMVRELNEDSYNIIADYSNIPVSFIIADGMGGHNSGEVASKMAVEYISNYILDFSDALSDEKSISATIKEAMKRANLEVYSRAQEFESNHGMGTTLIVAVVLNNRLYIGHIGDSRLYLLRDGKIVRITTDHSLIEELVRNGTITKEEAENHPKRNIITRALGCSEEIDIDTYSCRIDKNDTFVLCTDGLTNMLNDDEIMEIIEEIDEPQLACDELVDKANERGGGDNITVIIFKNN